MGMISDEPDRLKNIVSLVFSSAGTRPVRLSNGAVSQLAVGVVAQDDCAVFSLRGDQDLVVGSDYIRGPKFRLYEYGLLNEYDLGYYLVAANYSDIAAMGAYPIGLLSVVRYPADMTDESFRQVLQGIRDACAAFGAPNVGGDIGGAERLILSAAALGVCSPGAALLRDGAKVGDLLCMTGATGIAGAAMQYFGSGRRLDVIDSSHREVLLGAWKRPSARVSEGVILGENGNVSSCQDTSDGLKAAIEALAEASSVGFVVDESSVPVAKEVAAVCDFLDLDLLATIFGDSVDFELVFTISEEHLARLQSSFAVAGLSFTMIGRATAESRTRLRDRDGLVRQIPGKAWRHTSDLPLSDPSKDRPLPEQSSAQ